MRIAVTVRKAGLGRSRIEPLRAALIVITPMSGFPRVPRIKTNSSIAPRRTRSLQATPLPIRKGPLLIVQRKTSGPAHPHKGRLSVVESGRSVSDSSQPLARERTIVGLAISVCPPRPRCEGEEDRTKDPLDHGIALPKHSGATHLVRRSLSLPAFRCCPLGRCLSRELVG